MSQAVSHDRTTKPRPASLHMLSFRPDLGRLMRLAARERLLPPGDDPGYALHAVFAASFGALAPSPFALLPPGERGREWRLLAYSGRPLEDLRARASAFGDPDFLAPLNLDAAADKTMPEAFSAGERFGFRLRVRPTVRTGKSNPKGREPARSGDGVASAGKAVERDAFLGADHEEGADRGTIYAAWLAARLEKAGAMLEAVALDGFRRTRLMSRSRAGGDKKNSYAEGPDATMSGVLRVTDGEAFADGLAHGVGRHRAFGFGMLLLTPAGL